MCIDSTVKTEEASEAIRWAASSTSVVKLLFLGPAPVHLPLEPSTLQVLQGASYADPLAADGDPVSFIAGLAAGIQISATESSQLKKGVLKLFASSALRALVHTKPEQSRTILLTSSPEAKSTAAVTVVRAAVELINPAQVAGGSDLFELATTLLAGSKKYGTKHKSTANAGS